MKHKKRILGLLMTSFALVSCGKDANQMDNRFYKDMERDEFALETRDINEGPGLLDYGDVGVHKEAYENERKYGSESLTIAHEINGADFGLNGKDKKNDVDAWNKVLEEVKKQNGAMTKVILPKGELDFIESTNPLNLEFGLMLKGLKNVVFSGQNTTLYFHGETAGIKIEECENVYFENVNLDYGIPPFSIGTILESDGTTFKVQVNDGYSVDGSTRISAFLEYSPMSFAPRTRGNDIYGNVLSTNYLGDNVLSITFDGTYSIPPKGTLVILRHYLYEYDAIFIDRSKDVHFETVNIYSAPGMAARVHSSENLYFNRFNTKIKPNSGRLMTVTADALHFMDCLGDLKITNSLFENCGDDAVNVHGAFLEVQSVEGDKVLAVNPRGYNFKPSVGDKLEILSSLDLGLVSAVTVKTVKDHPSGGFVFTFEEGVDPKVASGQVIGNITRTPRLEFTNNIARNKRCRGVLVQTRHALIANNTFANLSDGGVLLTADANDWYESLPAEDVTIKNNKFLRCNYAIGNTGGDISITPFGKGYNLGAIGSVKNVSIENNFFGSGANAAVYANSVSGLSISHNLIANNGLLPLNPTFESGIYVAYSDNISLIGNSVVPPSSLTYKAIRVGPSINSSLVECLNNKGFSKDDISTTTSTVVFDLPKVAGKLSTDGLGFDDWAAIGGDVAIKGCADVDLNEVTPDPESFDVEGLKVAYSDDGLYIGFKVHDDDLMYSGSNYWEGDGVEIFLSADTESEDPLNVLKMSDDSCLQLFLSGHQESGNQVISLRTSEKIMEKKDQIKMSFVENSASNGYVGKAYIPFEVIPGVKAKIDAGEEFALTVNFNDLDRQHIRVQSATCLNPVEYNKYVPAKMSRFKVGGADHE